MKENSLIKIESLKKSLLKNSKKTFIMILMLSYFAISTKHLYNEISKAKYKTMSSNVKDDENSRNEANIDTLIKRNNKGILVTNQKYPINYKYYIKDNYLYNINDNLVNLENCPLPVYFYDCNITNELLYNINLSNSKVQELYFNVVSIDNDFVNYLPESVYILSLDMCTYITNLNELPNKCPNIIGLSLNKCSSLTDLSFIYNLPNLKELYIKDSAYIDIDLLNYLEDHNIKTNISIKDVDNSIRVDNIIKSIITLNMSDEEKIKAISLYVINNLEYNLNYFRESNDSPLSCALDYKFGVCSSYAYLTNILLNKAGIESFQVFNDSHGWNIIKLNNKYYYIDTTNFDDDFCNFLLSTFNISKNYMIDTKNTSNTAMDKENDESVIIPASLVDDINMCYSNKNTLEKNNGNIINGIFIILKCLDKIVCIIIVFNSFEYIPSLYTSIKRDYNEYKKSFNKLIK